jgi:hypothetical protein
MRVLVTDNGSGCSMEYLFVYVNDQSAYGPIAVNDKSYALRKCNITSTVPMDPEHLPGNKTTMVLPVGVMCLRMERVPVPTCRQHPHGLYSLCSLIQE